MWTTIKTLAVTVAAFALAGTASAQSMVGFSFAPGSGTGVGAVTGATIVPQPTFPAATAPTAWSTATGPGVPAATFFPTLPAVPTTRTFLPNVPSGFVTGPAFPTSPSLFPSVGVVGATNQGLYSAGYRAPVFPGMLAATANPNTSGGYSPYTAGYYYPNPYNGATVANSFAWPTTTGGFGTVNGVNGFSSVNPFGASGGVHGFNRIHNTGGLSNFNTLPTTSFPGMHHNTTAPHHGTTVNGHRVP